MASSPQGASPAPVPAKKELTQLQGSLISFTSGAAYGLTSVLVGQPFDVCKTRMQALQEGGQKRSGLIATGRVVFEKEGIKGLFRGGMPMWIGGALFRSAQFGCYETAMGFLGGPSKQRVLGLDPHVVLAGFAGGLGRGIVESPFEYVKVRRQVEGQWKLTEVYRGSGVTLFRNSFLFAFFVINIDLSKRYIQGGLSPFWTGALCSSAAWFAIWPLDVIKSRKQSGLYEGVPYYQHAIAIVREGTIFRGVVPGLIRSMLANGCSMIVYEQVRKALTGMVL